MGRLEFDKAKEELTLEEAGRRCGRTLDVHGTGAQVRMDCPFGCDGEHFAKREISVNAGHPSKPWRCHSYGCTARGDVVHLIHGLLNGAKPPEKVAGSDFLAAKKIILGESQPPRAAESVLPATEPSVPTRNVPLSESENETIRALVGMESKLVTDPERMPPAASRWWRMRWYLSAGHAAKWGIGVMPLDGGGDKRGWSLRGKVVFRFLSEDDKVLCYVGRDPEYEMKITAFDSLRPEKRDEGKAPAKYHFPKNAFARGLELYGQHASRLANQIEQQRESIARLGLIIVEGMGAVVALDALGIYAEAICSNQIADNQLPKIISRAQGLAGGKLSIWFDCDKAGDSGAKEAGWKLLQAGLDVRLAWSRETHTGKFRDKQPDQLTRADIDELILPRLRR